MNNFFSHILERVSIATVVERFGNKLCDLEHLFFFHAARSDCGRADANAARLER